MHICLAPRKAAQILCTVVGSGAASTMWSLGRGGCGMGGRRNVLDGVDPAAMIYTRSYPLISEAALPFLLVGLLQARELAWIQGEPWLSGRLTKASQFPSLIGYNKCFGGIASLAGCW